MDPSSSDNRSARRTGHRVGQLGVEPVPQPELVKQKLNEIGQYWRVIADQPSGWAEMQRVFHESYDADPARLPRRAVHWRFIEESPAPDAPGVLGFAGVLRWMTSRVVKRQMMNESPVLAVWSREAKPGAEAAVVFEVESAPGTAEGDGQAVGDLAPNAALCIETSAGEVLWPTYNPRRQARSAPRR